MPAARRLLKHGLWTVLGILLVSGLLVAWLWNDRQTLDDFGLPFAAPAPAAYEGLTATWFGTSMLLFDDGETQILIDAFVSRPRVRDYLLDLPVQSDAPAVNRFLLDYRLDRLAAIVPGHTHFDHALDMGAIANRSNASVVGSESALNIARGAGVPEDQLLPVGEQTEFTFGEFTVRMIPTDHLGFGWRGSVPFSGSIDEPLELPAAPSAFRVGQTYSIVVAHPQGTSLVQPSAGFVPGSLADVDADAVFLGVGMLEGMGRRYAEAYWQNLVTISGARRVLPVHFDDYTAEFGTVRLPPTIVDDVARSAAWLEAFRSRWDRSTRLELPVFGEPIAIYSDGPSTGV